MAADIINLFQLLEITLGAAGGSVKLQIFVMQIVRSKWDTIQLQNIGTGHCWRLDRESTVNLNYQNQN